MQPSTITKRQWQKVLKALYYSASSGFAGGFVITATGLLSTALAALQNGHELHLSIGASFVISVIVGGVVGALNSIAVTVKQLFTEPEY